MRQLEACFNLTVKITPTNDIAPNPVWITFYKRSMSFLLLVNTVVDMFYSTEKKKSHPRQDETYSGTKAKMSIQYIRKSIIIVFWGVTIYFTFNESEILMYLFVVTYVNCGKKNLVIRQKQTCGHALDRTTTGAETHGIPDAATKGFLSVATHIWNSEILFFFL